MQFRSMLLATAVAAFPVVASAQPIEGLYITGGVGLHAPQNTGIGRDHFLVGGSHLRLEQSPGFEALGSIGWALGNGARFEIEANFNQNAVGAIARVPVPASSSGSIRHYGAMANALFDMDVGSPWVYPYLGVGVGYQQTSAVNVAVTQNGGPFAYRTSDSQGAFAMQAIVGLSFPIPNMPGLSITPEYRFMDILGGQKLKGTGNFPVANNQLKNQFDHNFIIGVRYAFNVPPPVMPATAPVPAAASAARSYLVFFDWDKATLDDRARGIVQEAAAASKKVARTRIDVTGNADKTGTESYNQGLSKRRADAVAAQLVRDGIAKSDISVTANGDTHPLVPTAPGVREPQNRRVEIVLR